MTNEEPPSPDSAYWYTDRDRVEQLARIVQACDRLAELFQSRKRPGGSEYAAIASLATEMLARSCDHEEFKELARRLPSRPQWLDPRNPGWNMPRDSWMDDVASARSELDGSVLELRALGTY